MEMFAGAAKGTLIMLATMGLIFSLLALVTKRAALKNAVQRVRPEFATNLALALLNGILLAPLFFWPGQFVQNALAASPELTAFWEALHPLLVLALTILVADFVVYWRHRLEHHRLLWRFHATHHADTQYHWLTVLRKHPVSKLLSITVDACLLLILGFPAWAVAGASLIRSFWGFFIHADVPWTLGIFGRWLISPAAHRLHHIRDEALMGANYGNTVTLWDRLFGTYVDPAPYVDCETGIAEGTRGFLGELARPWERRYRLVQRRQNSAEVEAAT